MTVALAALAGLMPATQASFAPAGNTVPLPRPARTAPPTPDCGPSQRMVLAPVAGHAYHTAYFSSVGRETGYTDGAIPMIRMMPWSKLWGGGQDPVFTMQRILDGDFDRQLRQWFLDAKATGIPLLLEFGVEVNGEWFPWNGKWNGGGTTDGYGSPSWPDGPERFRDAYRHLVELSRATGADRLLTWNFHVDADGWPKRWWNQPKWYFPGRSYVDWLSVSDYGEQIPSGKPSHWNPFVQKLGDPADPASAYRELTRLDRAAPLAVIEFGVTEDPAAGDKAQWVADAYASMTPPLARYDVSLVNYWSEKWTNASGKLSDLRVQSSPGALAAYRAAIADPFYVTTPTFACL